MVWQDTRKFLKCMWLPFFHWFLISLVNKGFQGSIFAKTIDISLVTNLMYMPCQIKIEQYILVVLAGRPCLKRRQEYFLFAKDSLWTLHTIIIFRTYVGNTTTLSVTKHWPWKSTLLITSLFCPMLSSSRDQFQSIQLHHVVS